ncbi:hypothetical protein BT93_D0356 [Corymbia citriodora subsp. variegata]|nr:hypothetical protein BT93_D0356 [Corymbia citriodora subsp. variegata]
MRLTLDYGMQRGQIACNKSQARLRTLLLVGHPAGQASREEEFWQSQVDFGQPNPATDKKFLWFKGKGIVPCCAVTRREGEKIFGYMEQEENGRGEEDRRRRGARGGSTQQGTLDDTDRGGFLRGTASCRRRGPLRGNFLTSFPGPDILQLLFDLLVVGIFSDGRPIPPSNTSFSKAVKIDIYRNFRTKTETDTGGH